MYVHACVCMCEWVHSGEHTHHPITRKAATGQAAMGSPRPCWIPVMPTWVGLLSSQLCTGTVAWTPALWTGYLMQKRPKEREARSTSGHRGSTQSQEAQTQCRHQNSAHSHTANSRIRTKVQTSASKPPPCKLPSLASRQPGPLTRLAQTSRSR